MKGIAESEALIKRLREESNRISLHGRQERVARPRRKGAQFQGDAPHGGHRSSSSCANRLHSYGWRIGQKEWNPARKAFERITSRCVWKILSSGWPTVKKICRRPCQAGTHDVTRLAQLVAEGGAQLKTWTAENHLSMVANSVNMVPRARHWSVLGSIVSQIAKRGEFCTGCEGCELGRH